MFIPLHDANHLRHIRVQWVTLAIIVANCLVWFLFTSGLMANATSARISYFSYGLIPAVATGARELPELYAVLPEYTRFVTYAFLHGDFMHLAGNMLFIWVFGDNVEDAMGHLRFLVFFCLCAVAGAALHAFVQPLSEALLIGASGAAAGIITAYVMLHPNVKIWILALGRIPLRISALWVVGAWILFQLANFVYAGDDQVSWAAHVGGIAAGAILLPFFKRSNVPMFDRKPVDEVLPPVPPPAVAEEGYPLPGQPHDDGNRQPEEQLNRPAEASPESPRPTPWGRHGARK